MRYILLLISAFLVGLTFFLQRPVDVDFNSFVSAIEFTDSDDGGDSEIKLIKAGNLFRSEYQIGHLLEDGYVGNGFRLSKNLQTCLNWIEYRAISYTFNTLRATDISLDLQTRDPGRSNYSETNSFRFLRYKARLKMGDNKVIIPIKEMTIPIWARAEQKIKHHDREKYLDNVCLVSWTVGAPEFGVNTIEFSQMRLIPKFKYTSLILLMIALCCFMGSIYLFSDNKTFLKVTIASLMTVFMTQFIMYSGYQYFRMEIRISEIIFSTLCPMVVSPWVISYLHHLLNKLRLIREDLILEQEKTDAILYNIMPTKAVDDLKEKGSVEPINHPHATVMFTDYSGFSKSTLSLTPRQVIDRLDIYFSAYDTICEKYQVEKLKTVGDSYMCVSGVLNKTDQHAKRACLAALEILAKTQELNQKYHYDDPWDIRIGLHSGPVIAGVIGKQKFNYDIWGDTVNLASRMEAHGEINKVNISQETFKLVSEEFICEGRGLVEMKNMGLYEAYFIKNK